MKKLLSLFLILVMVLAFCGCEDEKDVKKKTPSTVTTQNDNGFSIGTVDGKTYRNEFLGLSFTIPDGWTFYTQEQILQLNQLTSNMVSEEIAEALENANVVYDMFAQELTTGSSINVVLEKQSAEIIETLDIKNALELQVPTIKATYTGIGYTDINTEYQKVTLDGKEFDALYLTAKLNGTDMYCYAICYKITSRLVNVTVCTMGTNNLDTLLECFTLI